MTGIVRCWTNRDFGFIQPLVGKPGKVDDVFCHKMALADGLPGLLVGAEVVFDLIRSNRGTQAANVHYQKRKVNAAVLIRQEVDAVQPALQRSHRFAERKSS